MEEIDLKELFSYFKDKISIFIIIVVGVTLIGSLYGLLLQKPMYSSYTTVILGGNTSTNTAITQTDITINKNLVDTYAVIVKSKRVLNQVIDDLDLDISYESLSGMISVSALNNTEVIKIAVNDRDANEAKDIADSIAEYFTKEVKDLFKMDNVNVLDEATVATTPYNINVLKQTIIYILIGIVLGLGVIFVIFYFDRTIKTVEQVEQKIKLPILGSVQKYSGKGAKK